MVIKLMWFQVPYTMFYNIKITSVVSLFQKSSHLN